MKAHSLRILFVSLSLASIAVTGAARAQFPGAEAPPLADPTPRLQVERLDGSLHALGEIQFDAANRTIQFPAAVNMSEGAIEFALVGTHGKTHESVFATDIRPVHLRTVLSLLNFEPTITKNEADNNAPTPDQKAAPSLVEINVTWEDKEKGTKKTVTLRECIVVMTFEVLSEFDEKVLLNPLPKGPWNYTGSRVDEAGFEAERELDFIAVQNRPSALFNLPHPNSDRDDLWQANKKILPAIGTPVTIGISLPKAKAAKPASAQG